MSAWGRLPGQPQRFWPVSNRLAALPRATSLLPHGNGRSYGDLACNDGGLLLHTRKLDRYIAFDAGSGIFEGEAGLLLSEVIALVLPRGWFLPVTPGTQLVTLGGAVANDVHGKNHHHSGSFGHHLLGLELLRSDGRHWCSPTENSGLFAATIAGLGLTGLITRVRLQLRPVPGPAMLVESQRFGRLQDFFALAGESDRDWEYTVAWVDCLAGGAAIGRGWFFRAQHVQGQPPAPGRRPGLPFTPPFSLVGAASLRAFNTAYYHAPRPARAVQHYQPFFYPLDGIRNWNRLYGPKGFYQYQCVLPLPAGADALRALLQGIAASGEGSLLAVLKVFGGQVGAGLLSFPRPGVTLALDFPNRGPSTLALFERFDAIVHSVGGALYPAKDARMPATMFTASFPHWQTFANWVDPVFSSNFWRRVQP